jgi:cytochrome c2
MIIRNSLVLIALVLVVAACGTVATPEAVEQAQETLIAEAATAAAETAAVPSATPTVAPSATPTEPPTNTPEPTHTPAPTETPEPTTTPEPTEAVEATDAEAEDTTAAGTATIVAGDPARGQEIFSMFYPEANFACSTCHLVDSETQLIGPGLLNIGERAATRVEGQSAEEYMHNSIVHPSDYVVENYPDMLMPQVYGDLFTEEEISDLVAYLFSLTG